MKGRIKTVILAAICALSFVCCACKAEFPYADMVNRPEIPAPITLPQAAYPEYPSEKPAAPAAGVVPSVTGYSASAAESPYTLEQTDDGVKITYADVSNYAYVYAPVENYSPEYGNIKITLENSKKPAAERIGVQAIYYEAKDLGYTPVTVFIGELVEGEQYIVSELAEHCLTDATYNSLNDEKVRDKTIIGFVIFIDSLPSYAPQADTLGECKIKNFEFLKDDDPKLSDRYVIPEASFDATVDGGATAERGEDTLTVTASADGKVYLPVSRYSSDFGKFTLTAKGEGTVRIGVRYKLDGEKTTRLSQAQSITLASQSKEFEYDFSDQFVGGAEDLVTQYVKGGKIDAVYIELPAGASVTAERIAFARTVAEGPYVTNVWKGCTGATVDRSVSGGNAKISVSFYTDWLSCAVSVQKGSGVKKIVYTVYAPDGLSHIGIGVATTSGLNTDGQNTGTYILRGSASLVNGNGSAQSAQLTPENNLAGVTETVSYNSSTKTYTFIYDFTNMVADKDGKTFADYTVNSLLFYFNHPDGADPFDGVRRLYFKSIELITE